MTRWMMVCLLVSITLALPRISAAQALDPVAADQHDHADQSGATTATAENDAKPTRGFVSALGHNLGDDFKHLPRWNSLYWLAGGGVAAIAIHPADNTINAHLVNKTTDALWVPGHIIGSTELILAASAGTYFIARHEGATRVQHLGMDEIEAAILAEAFTEGLKAAVRRPRPSEPGQSSTYSFPSGHSMLTFAAATVLQQHLGYKAAIPTYAIATYVAMSRLHDNRHYASDVVFGAAMGVVIGRTVTWHGRNFYASPMLVPRGGGIQLALAR